MAGLPFGFDDLILDLLARGEEPASYRSTGSGSTSDVPTTTTAPTANSLRSSQSSYQDMMPSRAIVLGAGGFIGSRGVLARPGRDRRSASHAVHFRRPPILVELLDNGDVARLGSGRRPPRPRSSS